MSSWWLIVGIVAGLLLLALIIMLATRSKESKSNYLKRSESFEKVNAVSRAKEVKDISKETDQIPYLMKDPVIEYRILFESDSGNTRWIVVQKEQYENIEVNERGELIVVNNRLIDFGERFGHDINMT